MPSKLEDLTTVVAVCDECGYREKLTSLTDADADRPCPKCGEVLIKADDIEGLKAINEKMARIVDKLKSMGGGMPMGIKENEDGDLIIPENVTALLYDHNDGTMALAVRPRNMGDKNPNFEMLKDFRCMSEHDGDLPEKIKYMHEKMHREEDDEEIRLN